MKVPLWASYLPLIFSRFAVNFDKNAGGYCVCQKKVVNLQRDLWELKIEN